MIALRQVPWLPWLVLLLSSFALGASCAGIYLGLPDHISATNPSTTSTLFNSQAPLTQTLSLTTSVAENSQATSAAAQTLPEPAPAETPSPTGRAIPQAPIPNEEQELWTSCTTSLEEGHQELARTQLRALLAKYPEHAPGLLLQSIFAEMDGKHTLAKHLRSKIDHSRPLPEIVTLRLLATTNDAATQSASARHLQLSQALNTLPAASNFTQGVLWSGKRHWGKAEQAFQRALIAERTPDVLYNLAVVHEHQKQFAEAINYYQQALASAEQQAYAFPKQRVIDHLAHLTHGEPQ